MALEASIRVNAFFDIRLGLVSDIPSHTKQVSDTSLQPYRTGIYESLSTYSSMSIRKSAHAVRKGRLVGDLPAVTVISMRPYPPDGDTE